MNAIDINRHLLESKKEINRHLLESKEEFEEARKLQTEFQTAIIRLRYVHSYLILMLNPSEAQHLKMLEKIEQMAALARGAVPSKVTGGTEFDPLAREILKSEWNRVKREI